MPQSIGALGDELMKREMARDPEQFKPKPFDLGLQSGPDMGSPMSPETGATLGSLADAASTYSFLKRGTGHEANAVMKHFGQHPEGTALGLIGTGLAMKAGRHLLRRGGMNGLADILAGVQGGNQMGIAAQNLRAGRGEGNSERVTGNRFNSMISGLKQ